MEGWRAKGEPRHGSFKVCLDFSHLCNPITFIAGRGEWYVRLCVCVCGHLKGGGWKRVPVAICSRW